MSADKSVVQAIQDYREARNRIAPLLAGVELLGLLRGAAGSGLFALTRTSVSVEQIADLLKFDLQRARELCNALYAHGVFLRDNELYRLAETWSILTDPEAAFPIQNVLDGTFARATALRFAVEGSADFWSVASDERTALAKSGSVDPSSPHSPAIFALDFETNVPELHSKLLAGGSYLELGCGVGGILLSTVRAYPNIQAMGIDLAPDLLEVAKQRASVLGISERVTFWQGDAQTFNEQSQFDYVWWSQFFFPPSTRAQVLEVALRTLKPGGFLIAPVMGNPSLAYERLESEMGQAFMRNRVLFGAWGIPAIGKQELQQELETAGFSNVYSYSTSLTVNPMVVARK